MPAPSAAATISPGPSPDPGSAVAIPAGIVEGTHPNGRKRGERVFVPTFHLQMLKNDWMTTDQTLPEIP
jgi:hypothetical protein